ncbi:nucleotidyltransferase family protein [Polaribacter sp.]|uniref:nucleotidyltransferase family protein n=1 Tax=Polaribacter sp. TaxID=1920175 RepID=UPI0025F93C1F|nr:nucleotidyltransferase family protein [Polaribacter sp.]
MSIAILVLAAGKSSRMQSIKQLEKVGNKTLLNITLEKAVQLQEIDIYCVLGANASLIKKSIVLPNITTIFNDNYINGLSTSIIAGLNYFKEHDLNFDAVFILLADQPAIDEEYLSSMKNLHLNNPSKIIATQYKAHFGVPVIIPKTYFKSLLTINGDKGAKSFINKHKTEVLSSKLEANNIDIDTQEELKLYRKSILK